MSIKPAQASVGALELMSMGIALMLDQRQLSEHILATVDGEAIRLILRHGTRNARTASPQDDDSSSNEIIPDAGVLRPSEGNHTKSRTLVLRVAALRPTSANSES